MTPIKEEALQALLSGGARCNLKLEFSDGAVLDNASIVTESLELDESVCESDEFEIGNVFSACFSVIILDDNVNREGMDVVVTMEITYDEEGHAEPFRIGVYKVKSNQRTEDRTHRILTCYDAMSDVLTQNVANGFFESSGSEELYATDTLSGFIDKMFALNGHEDIVSEIPSNIPNTAIDFNLYNTAVISGSDFLSHALALMGSFGYLDNQASYGFVMTNENGNYITTESGAEILLMDYSDSGIFTVVLPHTSPELAVTDGNYVQGSLGYEDFQLRYITGVKIVRTETISIFVENQVNTEVSGEGIDDATVDENTFIAKVVSPGTYSFSYDTSWKLNGSSVTLSQYGIAVTGTPASGDIIEVVFEAIYDDTEKDMEYMFGTETGNVYTLYNNMFLTDKTETQLSVIANNLLNALSGFTYIPSSVVLPAHINLRPGDTVQIVTPEGNTVTFPVLKRTLTGIQAMKNAIEARGTADMSVNANRVEAESIAVTAKLALSKANVARRIADSAEAIASATNQHFWDDDNGIHVSYQTKEEYSQQIAGMNFLANANGILLRNGKTVMTQVTPTDVTVGKQAEGHASMQSDGVHLLYGQKEMGSFTYNTTNGVALLLGDISGINTYITDANGFQIRNKTTPLAGISAASIWLGNSTNFSVNSSGHLTAKSANISGVLTAGSGSSIGGWTAYTSRLESDYTGSSGLRSGMQNGTTYVASSAVFYAGCSTSAGDPIADPSKTNWFVRQDGTMYGKTAYLGYTGADENQYVYVNNTGLTAYVMSSGSGTLQAVSVATLRGSVTYPSGIEKPTGTLNLGGAYISGTYARDEGLYKFTTNATFATLRADVLNVGGNKPITMRIIKKTNQSIDAAPSSGYVGTGKAFVLNANTPSGYRLVGCTVVNTNHAAACKIGAFYTDAEADTITVYLVNQATSAITDLQINIRAIYFAEGASSVMAEATG